MGIRTAQDPYGGRTGLVDKLIGNAFDVVHLVARHINEIKYLVSNMEAIIIIANNLPDTSTKTTTGRVGNRGATVVVPMPTGVTMANIVSSTVLVLDSENNAYQINNGDFSFMVRDGNLHLTLYSEAPTSMIGAELRWNVVYRVR